MKVLVACEESQRVCIEFRKRGHEAYSCDIEPCSGGHPEWHVQDNVLPLLNGNCEFWTVDGKLHGISGRWDMVIAFPPCTHLAVSGAKHFEEKRADGRQREGLEFFCKFLSIDCDKVAIENPVGIISGNYVAEHFPDIAQQYGLPLKPNQKIQPYMFGDPFEKTTCLWLKNLPKLVPTKIVEPSPRQIVRSGKTLPVWYSNAKHSERQKIRSKTFEGVAQAMATQWVLM